jgi:prepilin-type processing-associated H-X9-DG protein
VNIEQIYPMSWGATANREIDTSYSFNSADSYHVQLHFPGKLENGFLGNKIASMRHSAELYAMWDGNYCRGNYFGTAGLNSLPKIPGSATTQADWVRYAHNKGLNMMYADGHVAWMKGPLLGRGNQVSGFGTPYPDNNRSALFERGISWYAN